jgi:hypothetical protein
LIRNYQDADLAHYYITAEYKDGKVLDATLQDLINSEKATLRGDGTVFVPAVFVPSTEMIEVLSFTIKHLPDETVLIDGTDPGNPDQAKGQYSVKQYCVSRITNSTDPKLVALCYSMLNYGGYAQVYFPYKTDNPANAAPYNEPLVDSIPDKYDIAAQEGECTGIVRANKSVDLDSVISLRFYFKPEAGKTIDMYTFDVNGTPVEASLNSDGRFLLVIPNIDAPDLENVYKVTITNKADQSTMTVTYSVMAYAYNKQGASEALANLCKALYQYHLDAKAYFPAN